MKTKIKKVRTISDIKKHPAVHDVDSEEQFGEIIYFVNLKDGYKNSDDDVHSLNASSKEIVKDFNDLIEKCDCKECKKIKNKK